MTTEIEAQVATTRDADAADALARVLAERAAHRNRPLPVRVLTALGGFGALLAGIALLVPLPEGGIPLGLLGLRLLALEFTWAARAYAAAVARVNRAKRWAAANPRRARTIAVVAAIIVVGLLVLWLRAA